jgi:AAA+ superfamily predicted ATPase
MDRATDRIMQARAAVAADPADLAARLCLAEALSQAGDHREALEHYTAVLTGDPAHREALRGAAVCADAVGETTRADGYRRLLAALDHAEREGAASPETPGAEARSAEAAAAESEVAPRADHVWETGVGFLRRPALRVVRRDERPKESGGIERPSLTLSDVAGMEAVKRRLTVAFLAPLRNPELRQMYGKSLRGGLLLYGPPGCGKTFIARATAGELRARFLAVGLSDVLDMWLGESERKLHEIFQTARRNAPSVVFFDELDALGHKRSQLRHHAGRNVVNQLLADLDGIDAANDGIFVLGATNHPWDVDTALLRPGRFDRIVLVVPPDAAAREAILRYHLRDRPVGTIDPGWIVSRTDGFSGADLAHLCESATELAMEASATSGVVRPISMDHFQKALREIRPSTRAWFEMARNYALFANEGGVYDDLLAYMRVNKLL